MPGSDHKTGILATIALVFFAAALPCRADSGNGPTVVTIGHASLKVRPETLRLTMILSGEGKTARDAVTALAHRRDDVKQKLLALGAAESSIVFGEPTTSAGNLTAEQRQYQIMSVMQRNRAPSTQPQAVTAYSVLTAEWPIAAGAPDDVFATAVDLQEKIKSALSLAEATKQLTPEQQEVAEEMAAMADANGGKTNEPRFVFVHKMTEEQRSQVTAQAILNANTDAQRLAGAAHHSIGDVIWELTPNQMTPGGNSYTDYIREALGQSAGPAASPDEATGPDPVSVNYSVDVTVTFSLK